MPNTHVLAREWLDQGISVRPDFSQFGRSVSRTGSEPVLCRRATCRGGRTRVTCVHRVRLLHLLPLVDPLPLCVDRATPQHCDRNSAGSAPTFRHQRQFANESPRDCNAARRKGESSRRMETKSGGRGSVCKCRMQHDIEVASPSADELRAVASRRCDATNQERRGCRSLWFCGCLVSPRERAAN